MKFFTVAIHFHEGKVWNVDMLNRPPAAEEKYVKYINNLTYEQAEDLYRIISGDSQRRELGEVPKLELFARQETNGWDVWGNEVESSIVL